MNRRKFLSGIILGSLAAIVPTSVFAWKKDVKPVYKATEYKRMTHVSAKDSMEVLLSVQEHTKGLVMFDDPFEAKYPHGSKEWKSIYNFTEEVNGKKYRVRARPSPILKGDVFIYDIIGPLKEG